MIKKIGQVFVPGEGLEQVKIEIPKDWEHYDVYAEGKYIRLKKVAPKETKPLPGQMKLFTEEERCFFQIKTRN